MATDPRSLDFGREKRFCVYLLNASVGGGSRTGDAPSP
jgi:hypothetical protein